MGDKCKHVKRKTENLNTVKIKDSTCMHMYKSITHMHKSRTTYPLQGVTDPLLVEGPRRLAEQL